MPAMFSENGTGWRWVLAVFLLAGDQEYRLPGILHKPFHINWFLSFPPWHLFSSLWKSACVGPGSTIDELSSAALHISVASRNLELQLSLFSQDMSLRTT